MMLPKSRRQWPRGARVSKSDFKVGLSCPFKLLYRKQGLQTLKKDDPMLDFLAEGGFMVEALAHAVLSDQPDCEFEVTISKGRFHARVDALIDDGDDASSNNGVHSRNGKLNSASPQNRSARKQSGHPSLLGPESNN